MIDISTLPLWQSILRDHRFSHHITSLFGLGRLIFDCCNFLLNGFLVTKIRNIMHREIFIQMINERDSCRNVHPGNFVTGNSFKMLPECADGIAMRCNQDFFSILNFRFDDAFKVRCYPCYRIFQAFRQWELHIAKFLVRRLVFPVLPHTYLLFPSCSIPEEHRSVFR